MRISYATSFPGTFAWFGGSLGKVGPIFMDIVISERIFQVKNEKKRTESNSVLNYRNHLRFARLEKFSLNFSSSSFVIRVNLLYPLTILVPVKAYYYYDLFVVFLSQ